MEDWMEDGMGRRKEDGMEDGILPRATQPADTQAGCSKHAAQATPMAGSAHFVPLVHKKALFHGQKASQMAAVHRNGGFCGQESKSSVFYVGT